MMNSIAISVAEESGHIDDLAEWLGQYPALAGRISAPAPHGQSRSMGAAVDALVVAVGAGGSLTILARGLVAWAASHRQQRGVDVYVYAAKADGKKIVVDVRNTVKAEAVLRQVLEKVDDGEG